MIGHPHPVDRIVLCGATVLSILVTTASAAAAPPANQIIGFVDDINSAYEKGWSCLPGSDLPGGAFLYAGLHRIAIVPNAQERPDTSAECGPGIMQNGFQVDFTPIVLQQLVGKTNLFLYAFDGSALPALIPPANPDAANPYLLPSGMITSLSPDGSLTGLTSNASFATPRTDVAIAGGGPPGAGGISLGRAVLQPGEGNTQTFSFSSPDLAQVFASSPPGYSFPVYATSSYNGGPPVQLGSPAILGAAYLPLSAQMSQSGAKSGITSTIFTKWAPAKMSFRGLSGAITFQGNTSGFSEALVSIGYSADNQLACKIRNHQSPRQLPPISRLASFTLRSNDSMADTLPVSIALPYALPLASPAGTCLVVSISAGYLYLNTWSARYTTTSANLAAILSPIAADAPQSFAEGIGSEFHFQSGSEPSLYTMVALKMRAPAQLDAIAGSISAAAIEGAPQQSGWLPTPLGGWTANTSFFAYAAADCASLGVTFGNPTPFYTVGVNRTPTNYVVPPSATLLLNAPLYGNSVMSVQQSFFKTFPSSSQVGASSVMFSPDDCLVALHNVSSSGDQLYGNLDFENQSTAYFHLSPN